MTNTTEVVVVEIDSHARITINRPESLNALTREVLEGLGAAIEEIDRNSSVQVVSIYGAGGKAFVAGADIKSMVDLDRNAIAEYVELGQGVMQAVEACRVPVIAAVDGFALGGGMELALACDVIIASEKAKFGQPEVNLGIIPGFGGTQRLLQRCGIGAARRLVYTGEIIGSGEAYALGIVDRVVAVGEVQNEVNRIADLIQTKGPLAVQMAKKVIFEAASDQLNRGLKREVDGFLNLFETQDRSEGMRAFLEKRSPNFVGK